MTKLIEKIRHAKVRKLWTHVDLLGYDTFYATIADDIFLKVIEDEVTDLVMSKSDYLLMRHWLIAQGIATWDWDKKTVWGHYLLVE